MENPLPTITLQSNHETVTYLSKINRSFNCSSTDECFVTSACFCWSSVTSPPISHGLVTYTKVSLATTWISVYVWKLLNYINSDFTINCALIDYFSLSLSKQTPEFYSWRNNRQRFVIVKKNNNKRTAVFHSSVLVLTMNFAITLSKESTDPFRYLHVDPQLL